MYEVLSRVYDPWQQSYGKDYSTLILPRLLGTLRRLRIAPATMLDVGCGTGELAIMMARRGWKVWGIDASPGMLHHAITKARTMKLPLEFREADMRFFRLEEQFALATSLFDTLNHLLTQRDLLRAFRCIHRHLLPGGSFVFDVNNLRCYQTIWRQRHVSRTRAFTVEIDCTFIPSRKKARGIVKLSRRSQRDSHPEIETIEQRCFTNHELTTLLARAGFRVLQREDFNYSDVPEAGNLKTWWVAQRL